MAGPQSKKDAANQQKLSGTKTPPGHFLSSELESDTARFLAEVKDRIHRRRQAERRASFG